MIERLVCVVENEVVSVYVDLLDHRVCGVVVYVLCYHQVWKCVMHIDHVAESNTVESEGKLDIWPVAHVIGGVLRGVGTPTPRICTADFVVLQALT